MALTKDQKEDKIMREMNIPVDEFTTPCPISIHPGTRIEKIWELMSEYNVRHIPVTIDHKPIGIVTERDVLRNRNKDPDMSQAARIMSKKPYMVSATTSLGDVAYQMSCKKYGSAIVTNSQGHLVGIFTSTDALNALVEILRGETALDYEGEDAAAFAAQ